MDRHRRLSRRTFLGAGLAGAAGWATTSRVGRALSLPVGNPHAPLVLDDFDTDLVLNGMAAGGSDAHEIFASNLDPNVVGGERDLRLRRSQATADSNITVPGAFTYVIDAMDGRGSSVYLIWDGLDADPGHPEGGFGATDLTRGSTVDQFAFDFAATPFDVPNSSWNLILQLRSRMWGYMHTLVVGLGQAGVPWTFAIPFDRFNVPLLTDIDEIGLLIDTTTFTPGMTFALDRFYLRKG